MRKLFILTLAVLFVMGGIAFGAGIPNVVDAKNLPEVWITTVYNNDASALGSGTVVVWDFANSTGDYADQCNWVDLPDATANLVWTAGVIVADSIPAGGVGAMAIRGVVLTKGREDWTADDIVGTSATYAGSAAEVAADGGTTNDDGWLGVAVNAVTITATQLQYNPVYVQPTISWDND